MKKFAHRFVTFLNLFRSFCSNRFSTLSITSTVDHDLPQSAHRAPGTEPGERTGCADFLLGRVQERRRARSYHSAGECLVKALFRESSRKDKSFPYLTRSPFFICQILPYIDGIRHVAKIAYEAQIEVSLVKSGHLEPDLLHADSTDSDLSVFKRLRGDARLVELVEN